MDSIPIFFRRVVMSEGTQCFRQHVFLSTSMPSFQPACLPFNQHAFLSTSMPSFQPAFKCFGNKKSQYPTRRVGCSTSRTKELRSRNRIDPQLRFNPGAGVSLAMNMDIHGGLSGLGNKIGSPVGMNCMNIYFCTITTYCGRLRLHSGNS
jgi:hypothetical protein